MELSISGQRRQAVKNAQSTPQVEKKPSETGGAASALKRAGRDKTAWSQAALSFLQDLNRQDMEKQRKLLEAKQKKNSELDCLSEGLKVMDRCQKIASRIMKGDKVPPQDERYLMENDPDGYKLALACRKPKEKPKEWESVLDEDDQESGSSGGDTAEAVESDGGTAEAVESGGEMAEA